MVQLNSRVHRDQKTTIFLYVHVTRHSFISQPMLGTTRCVLTWLSLVTNDELHMAHNEASTLQKGHRGSTGQEGRPTWAGGLHSEAPVQPQAAAHRCTARTCAPHPRHQGQSAAQGVSCQRLWRVQPSLVGLLPEWHLGCGCLLACAVHIYILCSTTSSSLLWTTQVQDLIPQTQKLTEQKPWNSICGWSS